MFRLAFRWLWAQWVAIHDDGVEYAREPTLAAQPLGGRRKKGVPAPADPLPRKLDWRPLVILVFAAVSLTLQEYLGDRSTFFQLFPSPAHVERTHWELGSFAWWSGWRVLGYLVLPMMVVALMPGERLKDYNWSWKGFTDHIGLYIVLFAAVFPLVLLMSTTEAFQRIYPFYRYANRSAFDLVAWELLYAAQFVSLEFFFRGFLLHGLRRSLGVHAIWVMVVPYNMIHYGKTFAETMAAIVAGLILGTIAMRTRSIWGGVFIHIAVAVSMDLLALQHCTGVPCLR